MATIETIGDFLEQLAPLRLAEDWDNVGLLVGDRKAEAGRVMTCLTVTPVTAGEAIECGADLIVTHHPLPFSAVKRVTADTTVGRLLLDLIASGTAVYSAHTAFDSAAEGINQRLAEGLGLCDIEPLMPNPEGLGAGRRGRFDSPISLSQLAKRVREFLKIERLQAVGDAGRPILSVAVACGAAGEFLGAAQATGCDAMVVGETRFHTCLEAEATGIGLLLPGHFASERFALETLASVLGRRFPKIECWASQREQDPIQWM